MIEISDCEKGISIKYRNEKNEIKETTICVELKDVAFEVWYEECHGWHEIGEPIETSLEERTQEFLDNLTVEKLQEYIDDDTVIEIIGE